MIVVWLAASLTFTLVAFAPGDAATLLMGDFGDADVQARTASALGVDRPLWLQYSTWLQRLTALDLGFSVSFRAPVAEVIAARVMPTLALMLPALVISALLSIGLGLAMARPWRSERGVLVVAALLAAIPVYVIAQALIVVLSLWLGWLPMQGLADPRSPTTGIAAMLETLRHLVLPTTALALHQLVSCWIFVRVRAREELGADYVRMARAKGLGTRRIIVGHIWPHVRLGFIHFIAARLGSVLGGAVLVETVFGIPGMGRLLVSAAFARDVPLVAGIVLFSAVIVVIANAIADAVSGLADPRIADRGRYAV